MSEAITKRKPFLAKGALNGHHLALLAIFAVGCLVRLVGIGSMFTGINADEASIGYDAFAIAGWGIDRNGVRLPAYLIAWGSGQNAGYAYLLIPFIKLFGLSLTTLRLPMALAGCTSLFAMYTILRRCKDRRLVLMGMFLFAIFPWHILKSRWALESNLFPEFLLWGTALLCSGIANQKNRYFYLAFLVFGLSAWCYITSFLMLPLYLLPTAFVLHKRRYLTLPHLLGCFGILALAAAPLLLFCAVTLFNLPTIVTPVFTIPTMHYGRQDEVAILGGNPLYLMAQNARRLLNLLLSQDDGLLLNSLPGWGIVYFISMPLVLVGVLRSVLPRNKGGKFRGLVPGSWLFVPMLFSSLVLGVLVETNINRVNTLWIAVLWFWILGAYDLLQLDKLWRVVVPTVYLCLFLLFSGVLFRSHMEMINRSNEAGMLEAIRFADTLDTPVYVDSVHQGYIRVLFATQMPPDEFRQSIVLTEKEEGSPYSTVLKFGKWYCYPLPEPSPEGALAVVVLAEENTQLAYEQIGWETRQFGYYIVAWRTE